MCFLRARVYGKAIKGEKRLIISIAEIDILKDTENFCNTLSKYLRALAKIIFITVLFAATL